MTKEKITAMARVCNPLIHIVRVSVNQWVFLPFSTDAKTWTQQSGYMNNPRTADEVMVVTETIDVSLVFNPRSWEVVWKGNGETDLAALQSMAIDWR